MYTSNMYNYIHIEYVGIARYSTTHNEGPSTFPFFEKLFWGERRTTCWGDVQIDALFKTRCSAHYATCLSDGHL